MITADPIRRDARDGTPYEWTFRLVDETGDGWTLVLRTHGDTSAYAGYAMSFNRVVPTRFRETRELLRAKMRVNGVVRIPDAKLATLAFEDRVALDALLRGLAEHPPLKRVWR